MLKSRDARNTVAGYLFSLPALCMYLVFTVYPFFYGIYISFCEWGGFGTPEFIGISNYIRIFSDSKVFSALSHNAIYALGTVVIKLVFGFLIALILNKKLRGITAFRTIMFTPVVISFMAIGAMWVWILDPTMGLLNSFLTSIGLMDSNHVIAWLGDPKTALLSLMIIDLWKWMGYHIVLFLAGLQTIPSELYEAGEIDGANGIQKMFYITIPQIKNVFYMNLAFCLTGGFNVFDVVMSTTEGGPYGSTEVISKYIYDTSFGSTNQFGYAMSISMFVFVLMLIVTLIILRQMRRAEESM